MTDQPNTQPVDARDILVPSPERASFFELPLPDEPSGDRKLVLASGMAIRERFIITDRRTDGVQTGASDPAATAFTVSVSASLLDDRDKVVLQDGRPVIAPAHEITLTNEALGRLGSEMAVEAAIRDAREVAAARAELVFKGALLSGSILAGRS